MALETRNHRIVFRVTETFKVALDVHLARRQEDLVEFGIRAFRAQLKREGAAA